MGNPCTNCIDATTFNKGNECFTIGTDNIIYTGPPLPCSNIQTQDNFTEALQKLDAIICTLGAPQNLQGVLVTGNIATDIGAKFVSTVTPLLYTEILNDQVTSGKFIKIGGLPTEYLMADGSVTTNSSIIADIIAQTIVDGDITHAPSGNAVFDALTSINSAIALKADDALVIHNFGNEVKTGTLTVNAIIKAGGLSTEFLKADGSIDANIYSLDSNVIHTNGNETKTGNLTVNSIIRAGGTALQYLMADGSVTLLSDIISGIVTQTITNGDTTHAPSGDAVFDALALKQNNITLTVIGNSGPSTFISNTLNVPTYTLAGLGGQPLSADLTAIDALVGNLGFLYKTGLDTWTLDTNTYLTTINGIAAGGELAGTYPNPTLVNNAVTGKVLTGFTVVGGGILATDTILQAFGKTQDQINALTGGVRYLGLWDASTNTPALSDGSGTQGDMYIVSVAGATSLDGITPWAIGDRVYRDATKWTKPPAAVAAVGAGVPNYVARWNSVSTLTTGVIYDNGTNVGIGTSSPLGKLDVSNAGIGLIIDKYTGGVYGAIYNSGTVPSGTNPALLASTSKTWLNVDTGGSLAFSIGTSEKMNILSSGNVGIGTTNPLAKLHLSNSSFELLRLNRGSLSDYSVQLGGSGEMYITNNLNSILPFTILSNGNTGIGTINPLSKLQVGVFTNIWTQANGSANIGFGLYENGTNTFAYSTTGDTPTLYSQVSGTHIWYSATASGTSGAAVSLAERMRINPNGNVILPTSDARLIGGDSVGRLIVSNSTTTAYIEVDGATNANPNKINLVTTTGAIGLITNGTEKLTVLNNGNVGIGTTIPNRNFHVSSIGDTTIKVATVTSGNSIVEFENGGQGTWYQIFDRASGSFITRRDGADRMTINSSGDLGLGTTPLSGGGGARWITANGTTTYGGGFISSINGVTKGSYYSELGFAKVQGATGEGVKLDVNGATTALTALPNGNVGIGTTNPLTTLNTSKVGQTIGTTIPSGGFLLGDITNTSYSLELGVNAGSGPWIQSRSYANTTVYPLAINPSGGNVGIGTAVPIESLHVVGNGSFETGSPTWATSAAGLLISGGNGGGLTSYITTYLDDSHVFIGAGTTQKTGMIVHGQGTTYGSSIYFQTGGTPKVSINSAGALRIASDTAYYSVLDQAGIAKITSEFTNRSEVKWYGHTGSTSDVLLMTLTGHQQLVMNGTMTATGFFTSSDARLKDIIRRDGDVIYFKWKDGRDDQIHIGYEAQEKQITHHDQVQKGDDDMLTLNYIEILVDKIRSLEKRIEELENR